MILLTHNDKHVVAIEDLSNKKTLDFSMLNPIEKLFFLAEKYSDSILVWCHEKQKENLNIEGLKESFNLKNIMMSFSCHQYLPLQVGYVEDSPFLKVNKTVKYPTWLMSSQVGAIHASQLIKFKDIVSTKDDFNYTLNSIAKLGMPKGLFCYSEPKLLNDSTINIKNKRATTLKLFMFVKQHYKSRWIYLLLINFIWYDKNLPIIPAINSLFYKKRELYINFITESLQINTISTDATIDVIIPTMGRKTYLHNVLKDLAVQVLLPKQVIIVEQNADVKSLSELDFLTKEIWPFNIQHKFIHQTGVCNARNLALSEVTSKYVYLADDDNRFDENLLQKIIKTIEKYNFKAISMSYLKKGEVEKEKYPIQWPTFGGGCSVINSKYLKKVAFNMALEFGYGEDADFGMQLRNCGVDVIYFPNIKILHLKAPIGGFRFKYLHPWEHDTIKPKPSPTVMLNRGLNTSKHQLLGYKTILFIKFYKDQNIKNPFTYYKRFKKQWTQSIKWANKLKEKSI